MRMNRTIKTDTLIQNNRPGILIYDKKRNKVILVLRNNFKIGIINLILLK